MQGDAALLRRLVYQRVGVTGSAISHMSQRKGHTQHADARSVHVRTRH